MNDDYCINRSIKLYDEPIVCDKLGLILEYR